MKKKIKYQNEQIEGYKLVINKFTEEKEKFLFNEEKKPKNDIINKLKEAKLYIIKLEEENKNLRENKLMNSGYKSEGGEEEYSIKQMVKESKKRNQSDDIKIDYPGLSNIKEKYEDIKGKFNNLQKAVVKLIKNLNFNDHDIKPMIDDVYNALNKKDDIIL